MVTKTHPPAGDARASPLANAEPRGPLYSPTSRPTDREDRCGTTPQQSGRLLQMMHP